MDLPEKKEANVLLSFCIIEFCGSVSGLQESSLLKSLVWIENSVSPTQDNCSASQGK